MAAGRRGRGEGSIYRRKDGWWVGQYEVGGKRRYVYGKTRKEVASKLTKAVADGNEGLIFDSDHLTALSTLTAGWTPYGIRCVKAPGLGTRSTFVFM